jgi:diguanylate cyclase (GGDEF)-like protein
MDDLQETVQRLAQELEQTKRQLRRKDVELQAVLAQSEEISYTDPLTFLPNRRKIVSSLQHEVLRSNRYRTPLSISMMDVDHFKRINDSHGHAAGDEVLRTLASVLREGTRDPDTAGRLGGEEFLVLLPNAQLRDAAKQAERLCKRIRELSINVNGQNLSVTVSVGLAEYRIGEEGWEEFLQRADAAMYQAKHHGRDGWAAGE